MGTLGTWTFTYHAGSLGVDDGGRIFLLTDAVSEWELQTDRPREANYVSVTTTARAKVAANVERRRAGPRPYWGGVVVTVTEGDIPPGATVTITVGDTSHGGPGARVPRIARERLSEIRVLVDALNNASPVRVADSPAVRVVAGQARRFEAVWPSEVPPGGTTWLLVKVKDEDGNPASYEGEVRIEGAAGFAGVPRSYRFVAADRGHHRFEPVVAPRSGSFRVTVTDTMRPDLSGFSNLLTVAGDTTFRPYCGDLHGQHPVSPLDAERYAEYGRGFGGIDFMSWAANDFHVTDAAWRHTGDVTRAVSAPGRFVVFPGYEWSATTSRGGDHNVVHLDDGRPILRSGYAEHDRRGYDPSTDRYTMGALLASMDPGRTLLMPHVGGRRANLDVFDGRFMSFIEVYSDHGQFEWFLRDALARGLRTGFVASSDDVFGRPGDSPPGSTGLFAVHGGLTCVHAEGLTREALWDAFRARRVYGTTGERIRLRLRTGDHWMGEEVNAAGPVTFSAVASGTAGIERIELFRGSELMVRRIAAPEGPATLIKVIWRGAASKERGRQTLWRGSLALDRGRILSVARYRLDEPTERLVRAGDAGVSFQTMTAGDEDGAILAVDAPVDARLTFDAVTNARNQFGAGAGDGGVGVRFDVPLDGVTTDDTVFDAGGVDREVVVRRVGTGYPATLTLEWTEATPPPGTSAYWIRVLQTDGATAWSSPIFVTR